MSRQQGRELIDRLCQAQQRVTDEILENADFDKLGYETPDGFTVNDMLRMWVWHYWSHHRDLVLAHGRLTGDNPHFHVPHYVRQANEEFGRFIGELACLSDEQLDLCVPGGGRSVREIVEHTLATLEGYFTGQIERARPADERRTTTDGRRQVTNGRTVATYGDHGPRVAPTTSRVCRSGAYAWSSVVARRRNQCKT